ncbi:MAG: ABC transporter permease, partial [Phocaeicola sp.]|nr:ABC transporter permease [Phocaeicola sp.]
MKQLYYAIQTLWRGKHSVWIKVVSLASGLLISIILFAKVAFELDYDCFYEDAERVFLVETAWGNDETGNGTPSPYIIYPTAAAIAGHFPEAVESYTTFSDFVPSVVVHGKKKHKGAFVMADSLYCPTLG